MMRGRGLAMAATSQPEKIACPHCGAMIKSPGLAAGSMVGCPKCGQGFRLGGESGDRGQESGVGEVQGPKSKVQGQGAEVGGQRSEVGGQRSEVGGQQVGTGLRRRTLNEEARERAAR